MATVNYGINAVSTVASGGVAHIFDTSTAYSAGTILSVREATTEFMAISHDRKLQCPVGTEALPGVTFYGDTDNGLYRIGADNVGLSIGGTKRWDFSTATSALTGDLTVSGSVTIGADTVLSRGAANRLDLASGDSFQLVSGILYVGDTANANMTAGLTLNQAGADNEIIALKSSDVAHGITGQTEADTFGLMRKISATNGGVTLRGLSGGSYAYALELIGMADVVNTVKTTGAAAPVVLDAYIRSGAGVAAPSADGNLVAIAAGGTVRFIFDTEGTLHAIGATATDSVGNGLWFLNDTANANMTLGLTINQGASDNLIFGLKSSDVATGLTTATLSQDVETDDFFTIAKVDGATGGARIYALAETTRDVSMVFEAYGGTPTTTDTTASVGAMAFLVAQHDGANALQDMAANSNGFTWAEVDSGGTALTRMLLKADDGELHLGNTTLVALDAEDDVQAVRALQIVRTEGRGIVPNRFDRPTYSYNKLRELGVVGERDERGDFMIRVQPYLNLHDGALWQLHTRQSRTEEAFRHLLDNPTDRDGALRLLEA